MSDPGLFWKRGWLALRGDDGGVTLTYHPHGDPNTKPRATMRLTAHEWHDLIVAMEAALHGWGPDDPLDALIRGAVARTTGEEVGVVEDIKVDPN